MNYYDGARDRCKGIGSEIGHPQCLTLRAASSKRPTHSFCI